MIDLNKVPSDNAPSPPSADYFSAQGNSADTTSESNHLDCHNNADSRDDTCTVFSADRTSPKMEIPNVSESLQCSDATDFQALPNEKTCSLVFPKADSIHEVRDMSQPSACGGDDAGVVVRDLSAGSDGQVMTNNASKGRRGRKRKVVDSLPLHTVTGTNSNKESIDVKAISTIGNQRGRKKKMVGSPSSLRDMETNSQDLSHTQANDVSKGGRGRKGKAVEAASCPKYLETNSDKQLTQQETSKETSRFLKNQILERGREESSQFNAIELREDVDMGGGVGVLDIGDASLATKENSQDYCSKSRGRKRKVMESLQGSKVIEINKNAVKLASDCLAGTVGRVLRSRTLVEADSEKQPYEKDNGGLVGVKREIGKRRGTPPLEKLKKKRGKPPKLQAEYQNPKVGVKKKLKLEMRKIVKKPKMETDSKSLKVQGRNSLLSEGDNEVENDKEHAKSHNQLASKSKKCTYDRCQHYLEANLNHPEKSVEALNSSKCKKKSELGRKEEKQLVRDQIISILRNAGWTIEYRPRMSKEYHDAVYVDCEGRTYWSVTLAYKKLRHRIEKGTADSKAVDAFVPIPEEKLCTLFRITKDKKGGQKRKEKVHKAGKTKKEGFKQYSCKSGRPKSTKRPGTKKPCTLLARHSENGLGRDGDGYVLYEGKRTLLAWMIDSGTLPPDVKIQLRTGSKKNVSLEGKISSEGIICSCCDAKVTLSVFVSHAGCKLDQPLDSIYLDSGRTLSQCLTDGWRKHVESNDIGFHSVDVSGDDPNDDTCNLCGDGGDLICCDSCPSTFHQSCLKIQKFPSGDWRCVYCSCKLCGMISKACQTDDAKEKDDFRLLACLLCEEKFHLACVGDVVDNAKKGILFCERKCQKIFERLHNVLGVRHELEDGFSWTILRCQDIDCDENQSPDSEKVVCNSKLALAFSIMDECFLPIIDPKSQTNMVQRVVFGSGSNFRRLNYSGFCTFILERGDEVVSAAAIRIHGYKLAEMPFIGTRYMYRRQGMCRRLLNAIEMALGSLDIEKLVIPAVSALNDTWTNVFGFSPLEESERQDMKYMSMVLFPGTDMLKKPLRKWKRSAVNLTSDSGLESSPHHAASSIIDPDCSESCGVELQRHVESAANVPNLLFNDVRETSDGVLGEEGLDLGAPRNKWDSSINLSNHSSEVGMLLLAERTTNVDLQFGPETVFCDKKESPKCNLDLNREYGVDHTSLSSSVTGQHGLILVGKVLHVGQEGKEALPT